MHRSRAREEAEERQAEDRKKAVASAKAVFKKELAEQIAERQAARNGKKVELACEETVMEAFHQVWGPPACLSYFFISALKIL